MTEPVQNVPSSMVAILIIAVVSLAGVIVYLFKFYSGRQTTAEAERVVREVEHAKERGEWATERERLRADYEARYRVAVEKQLEAVRQIYGEARDREDEARREYLANMETVAAKAQEVQERVGQVLRKLYERYSGTGGRKPH